MPTINAIDFIVKTDDLQQAKFVEKTYPEELSTNQVLLGIEQFAFTSNNNTYGLIVQRMNYWNFFPTRDGYGILPAWGIGRVVVSNHPDVSIGQRFYGYYPMSSHLVVTINRTSRKGFMESSEHRQALPSVYNFYLNNF